MVIFLHRPEYYGILASSDGLIDYKDKAEVIISKHRKGATGIIVTNFLGQYTRFENSGDNSMENCPPTEGGLYSEEEYDPFKLAAIDGYRGGY